MATRQELETAYLDGFKSSLEKQAMPIPWTMALPIGVLDTPAAADVPKYIYRGVKGPDPEDPSSPGRTMSGAMTVSAVLSTLFALGFTGLGLKALGRKLQFAAMKRKGVLPTKHPLYQTSREMNIPAYTRAREYMERHAPVPAMKTPMGVLGTAVGGAYTPFEKLENYLTRSMASRIARPAERGRMLEDLGGAKLFHNPAVSFAMHPLAIATSVGIDAAIVAAAKARQREAEKAKSPERIIAEMIDPSLKEETATPGDKETVQQKILGKAVDVLGAKPQPETLPSTAQGALQ